MIVFTNALLAQIGKLSGTKLKHIFQTNLGVKKFLAKWGLLGPQDDHETIYFKVAFEVYRSRNLSEEMLAIILHKEPIDAFILSAGSDESLLFERALDDQLHRIPNNKGATKELNEFPRDIIIEIQESYNRHTKSLISPTTQLVSNETMTKLASIESSIENLSGSIDSKILKQKEEVEKELFSKSTNGKLPTKKNYPLPKNYIKRFLMPIRVIEGNQSHTNQTLNEIIKGENNVTILGVAGTGKSIELNHLAWLHSNTDSQLFPVKIRLNVITTEDVIELLRIEYTEFDRVPEEKILILLDALDEVHPNYIDIVAKKIKILKDKYSKSKIVLSCRNNFYTAETDKRQAKIEDFRTYTIQGLQYNSIYAYLEENITLPPEEFLKDIKRKKYYDLLFSPFYLVNLVDFYNSKGEIPDSKKTVYEHLINERLEKDLEKFENSGLNLRNYTYDIRNKIREIAVVGESLGRNYLHGESELQRLIYDKEILERIKRTFLFNESFENDRWGFEHNNFQEFLAAEFLSYLPVKQIQEFISFKPEFVKIKPSWLNTVSFLFSILDSNEDKFEVLLSWLLISEPDVLIRFEKDKIDIMLREKLFLEIYEDYESKGIIIRNEKFESEDLAIFVSDSTSIIEYLIEKVDKSSDRLILTEALRILHYFEHIKLYKIELRNILMTKLCDPDLSDETKYACFNALDDLRISDVELTKKILEHNDFDSSQYLRAGVYRYLKSSEQYEEHLPILLRGIELLEGIKVTVNSKTKNSETNLYDEKATLERVLDKIESPENVLRFLKWAGNCEEPTKLEGIFFDQVGKMLIKATKGIKEFPEFYEVVLSLLISFSRRYQVELMTEFQSFFEETDNQLRAFKSLYHDWNEKSDENFYLTSAMVVVTNEDCIEFLTDEIKSNSFVEPKTWQFRNAFWGGHRSDMYDLYQEELIKIDHDKYAFKEIDHRALETSRRKRDIELLLSKEDFLNEIKRIFREESSEPDKLTWDEVYNWKSTNFNDEKMSNHLALEILREFAHHKKYVSLREVEDLVTNEKRWKWLQISKIVQYDKNRDDFEYSKELYQLVCDWVNDQLKTANFNTAIEYRKDNKYHYRYSELYVSYFIQRLQIKVSNMVLLDLLSIQCYLLPNKKIKSEVENKENRKPNTFDFVVEKLGLRKVIDRIITNLENNKLVPVVKESHFEYCEKFRVLDAAPFILEEIKSDEQSEHEKRVLVTQYVNLNSDLQALLETFDYHSVEIKLHMAEKLGGIGYKPMLAIIQKAIADEGDEDKRFRFIQSMFKIDEMEGFLSLKKWIIKNKRLPERTRSFDYFSKAEIKELIELFEHSVNHNYGDSTWSNREIFIEEIIKKGSLSEENYFQVKNQLKKWINMYEDLKYLHYQIQHLDQLYYSQKTGTLELDQVLKLIESCSN